MPCAGLYAMWSMISSVIILFATSVVYSKSQISDDVQPQGCLASFLIWINSRTSDIFFLIRRHYGMHEFFGESNYM